MNRRGDTPTILLFVVALILTVSALYAFSTFKKDVQNYSTDVNKLIEPLQFNQDYIAGESKFIAYRSITCKVNCQSLLKERYKEYAAKEESLLTAEEKKGLGNFFARIRNDDFIFEQRGDIYYLEVKELFVYGINGASKVKRNFELKIGFDSKGQFDKVYK